MKNINWESVGEAILIACIGIAIVVMAVRGTP